MIVSPLVTFNKAEYDFLCKILRESDLQASYKIESKDQVSAVSRLFSPNIVRELSRKGSSEQLARLIKESRIAEHLSPKDSVGAALDFAFTHFCKKNNRHEYVYKAALTHKILLGTHSLRTASMLNEFRVGSCKADVVILNGTGTVYEIKSERDSLTRLQKQVCAYRDVFAKVNVITGENHIKGVIETIPSDVGITQLSDRYKISTVREAAEAPERTKPVEIFKSLQAREAKLVLKEMKMPLPEVPNTKLYSALHEIFEKLDPIATHETMVKVLKKTRSLVSLSKYVDVIPHSLLAAVFAAKIRKGDYQNLLRAIETPIGDVEKWN